MSIVISSHSNSIETSSVANYTLRVLNGGSFTFDTYFSDLLVELGLEEEKLESAINIEKRDNFTEGLYTLDQSFDQTFICLKTFVDAYLICSNPEQKEAAGVIHRVLELNNPQLYRLGYELESNTASIFIKDVERPEIKAELDKLEKVAEEFVVFKQKTQALQNMLMDKNAVKALKEKIIPSYVQRGTVRDLLNAHIFPFVDVMGRAKPAEYGELAKKIDTYVQEMNSSIKARSATKPSPNKEEPQEEN